jgi:bifunctional non-homologous end joining protein LigD
MTSRVLRRLQPMLATLAAEPFDRRGWVYEEKYDGDRVLAYKQGTHVVLRSRNGRDNTPRFPDIAAAVSRLKPKTLVLDGEVVVFDGQGISRFQLLQRGLGQAIFAVFDCLYLNGKDLRHQPLSIRREALESVVKTREPLLLSRRLAATGLAAYDIAAKTGYEGLVAKDLSSPYVGQRSRSWLKVKVHQEDEFVIVGYTAPAGSRQHFGALLLGAYDQGRLRYAGKVGTGFDAQSLADLHQRFRPLVTQGHRLLNPPRERNMTFLRPRLVAQIAYQELTADRRLRQAVYLGLRHDKPAKQVRFPSAVA